MPVRFESLLLHESTLKIMKEINYRTIILNALLFIALITLFMIPDVESASWLSVMIISKTICFASGYALCYLSRKWELIGKPNTEA